ncbi:MAG TPA: hypothetical protein VIK41_28585 [Gemmatimonadaceae bacterium]|jgi:hypothetical protein
MIGSLDRLLAAVQALDAGDMVVAWEPLATGLETKHEFKRIAEFRCWLSLYCHKRWQRGALRALKRQFKELSSANGITVGEIAREPSSVSPWSSRRSSTLPPAVG